MSNNYKDSEFYGYTNGKLLWYAHYGLFNDLSKGVFAHCGDCQGGENDRCGDCVAMKAESALEKQIINEGVAFMTKLATEWRQANAVPSGL